MSTSGTYTFNPDLSDLLLEAFSRIQVKPASLTQDHLFQARLSANLLLTRWSNRQPNLWRVQLLTLPLIQGQPNYALPPNVVTLLDAYIRTYVFGAPQNLANIFSTTLNSTSVKVTIPNHGLVAGNWFILAIPVSVGGMLLYAAYQAVSILDVNNFTITGPSPATSNVVLGGVVPQFVTTVGSSTITVNLPNHGYQPQQTFSVPIATTVGGIQISGSYPIQTVPTPDSFTILAANPAGFNNSAFENGGMAQFEVQQQNVDPTDYFMYPISRTEYSAQPDKASQGRPTTFWFNRQTTPQINFWQAPDQNGPYLFSYYAVVQDQDASFAMGGTLDIPYRFLEAFTAGLAYQLARKYPPPPQSGITLADLKLEAKETWDEAAKQDTEEVPLFVTPGLNSYSRW